MPQTCTSTAADTMQFLTIITLLMPLALADDTWSLSGTCSSSLTCEIDTQYTSPELPSICGNLNGNFNDTGTDGKTNCKPAGTKCTYVWAC